jgi:hypothetical protein
MQPPIRAVVLTFGILLASLSTAFSQGTIQINSGPNAVLYDDGTSVQPAPVGTPIGVFWGMDAAGASALVGMGHGILATPTTAIGPVAGSFSVGLFPIPAASEGQRIWLKVGGWISPSGRLDDATAYGESAVVSVVLGPTAGPGTNPFPLGGPRFTIVAIPEPSTWAVVLLSFGVLLFRRRKV